MTRAMSAAGLARSSAKSRSWRTTPRRRAASVGERRRSGVSFGFQRARLRFISARIDLTSTRSRTSVTSSLPLARPALLRLGLRLLFLDLLLDRRDGVAVFVEESLEV